MEQKLIKKNKKQNIKQHFLILIRILPSSTIIKEPDQYICAYKEKNSDNTLSIIEEGEIEKRLYKFTYVKDGTSTQEDIYKTIGQPLLQDLLKGISCTIIAYGQTGTGKTYTIFGNINENNDNKDNKGIVMRSMEEILTERKKNDNIIIEICCFEIYLGNIVSLIKDNNTNSNNNNKETKYYKLPIRQEHTIPIIKITDNKQFKTILNEAINSRITRGTIMNQRSSRSHAIFKIIISQKLNYQNKITCLKSVFTLVDLAGSESLSNCFENYNEKLIGTETKKINSSVFQLGFLINDLANGNKFKSYKNDVLTQVLQENLDGGNKVAIIGCINPMSYNRKFTKSTLSFVSNGIKIETNPKKIYEKWVEHSNVNSNISSKDSNRSISINISNSNKVLNMHIKKDIYDKDKKEDKIRKNMNYKSITDKLNNLISYFRNDLRDLSIYNNNLEEENIKLKRELELYLNKY